MEIPFGLLLIGGIIIIVIGAILLFALGLLYIVYEQVFAYAAVFLGLAVAAWIVVSVLRIPISIPFLSPANTPEPLGTPALSKGEIERALAASGRNIELLNFELGSDNVAKIEFKFDSTLPNPDDKRTEAAAFRLICAVRHQRQEAIPHDLKLVAQSRHKNQVFGFGYTRHSGELNISAGVANRINC